MFIMCWINKNCADCCSAGPQWNLQAWFSVDASQFAGRTGRIGSISVGATRLVPASLAPFAGTAVSLNTIAICVFDELELELSFGLWAKLTDEMTARAKTMGPRTRMKIQSPEGEVERMPLPHRAQ
jgi:hypothetical protein